MSRTFLHRLYWDSLKRLENLPPIGSADGNVRAQTCKICGSIAPLFDVVDFLKFCSEDDYYAHGISGIEVPYHRCSRCGFLFTDFFDRWQTDEFRRHIYNADYIKIDADYASARPSLMAKIVGDVLIECRDARILDYGSGSGAFCQFMQIRGFGRIQGYDPFSDPNRPEGDFDIITCLEVLEHSVSPLDTVMEMRSLLAPGGCIIFSQSIQPANIEEIRYNWWYAAPRNGHVSTFTEDSLALLGRAVGLALYGDGWLFVYGLDRPSAMARIALSGFGCRRMLFELKAPDDVSDASQVDWHETEEHGQIRFRWTHSTVVQWPLPDNLRQKTKIRIRIPFVLEIRAGFARECSLSIGGTLLTTSVRRRDIVGEATLSPCKDPVVRLETPPPQTPVSQGRGPDSRLLGLAIPV